MRSSLSALVLLISCGHTLAADLTDTERALLRKIGADPSKRVQATEILGASVGASAMRKKSSADEVAAASRAKTKYADTFSELVRKQEGPRERAASPKLKEFSPCAGFKFLLRQDWKDIGFLDCPKKAGDATGAEIAFANDRANNNRTWSVNGTAALTYSSLTSDPPVWWTPYYTSFATYVTANRIFNSSTAFATSDVDKLAYGLALELGWETSGGANYFRVRGGQVENNLKGTTSATVTAELIPVYYPWYIHYPIIRPFGLPISVRTDPEVLVQYAQVTGKNGVLDFNGRSQALRVGPELSVYLFPETDSTSFLSRMNASLTYHWSYEAYANKPIDWLQAAVIYNIDDAGHLALGLTYKRGRDEDTGTFADIYRIALTGKI